MKIPLGYNKSEPENLMRKGRRAAPATRKSPDTRAAPATRKSPDTRAAPATRKSPDTRKATATRKSPGNPAPSLVTALLLFLCVICVAFYTYQKNLNPSVEPGDFIDLFKNSGSVKIRELSAQYDFSFESSDTPLFAAYKDNIVKFDSAGIRFLDKKGMVLWSDSTVAYNKPIIKTNGTQLLAADVGGGGICVFGDRTVIWRDKLDAAIMNADISEDGYVTVITSSKRDNNEIRVFDPHGIELIRKIIANDFAVAANISPSGKILVMSGISSKTVQAYSTYKFYDLKGNDLAECAFNLSGEILPLFCYNSNDSLFAVGDREAASLNSKGKTVWEKQFGSVKGAAAAGDNILAVASENDDGAHLALYSFDGRELSACKLLRIPQGLAAVKGMIAVNANDTVYFYNEKCENVAKYSSGGHIQQILFFGRRQAAVITDGKIAVVNI